MGTNSSEVKLQLKKPIIGFKGKSLKDSTDMQKILQEEPNITPDDLQEKLPDLTFGMAIQNLLLNAPLKDTKEQLKVYRWAEKIELKIKSNKGEMLVDLNQITELEEYISKIKGTPTVQIAPILIYLEKLKDELKNPEKEPKQ